MEEWTRLYGKAYGEMAMGLWLGNKWIGSAVMFIAGQRVDGHFEVDFYIRVFDDSLQVGMARVRMLSVFIDNVVVYKRI